MSLSLKELITNHTRGISPAVHTYQGEYFENEIPQINDLTDLDARRATITDQANHEVQEAKKRRENRIKQVREAKLAKAIADKNQNAPE